MAKKENDIPESSLTSAITTDLPNEADAAAGEQAMADHEEKDPLVASGLGLIKVDGFDFRYVGISPQSEENAETPGGLKITGENSTFTPISQVPFSPSIRIKDPASGEFYFAADGVTSWEACELNGSYLVPRKEAKEMAKAKAEGKTAKE